MGRITRSYTIEEQAWMKFKSRLIRERKCASYVLESLIEKYLLTKETKPYKAF